MRYYVVVPVHNEEKHLRLMLQSLVSQSLLPAKAIVVNDHSTDGSLEIIKKFDNEYEFIQVLDRTSSSEHLPGGKVVRTFNAGLDLLDEDYDFIVKLDADIVLPENYFEEIAKGFSADKTLGIFGGMLCEQDTNSLWVVNHPMNKNHVRGAIKSYSKNCFMAIGGLKKAMGWDTVDELLAMYHGFKVRTLSKLNAKHLRPLRNRYSKKARLLQGKAFYGMRYGFFLTLIASFKMLLKQKDARILFDNLSGYLRAKAGKVPYLVSKEEGVFIRKYRYRIIFSKLRGKNID